jgi:hypothetical protein
MAKRDLDQLLAVATASVAVAAKTDGTVNGTSTDLKGYHSCIAIVDALGAWTDGVHTIKLQESADDSTFTDVAEGQVVVDGAADDAIMYKIPYQGAKRYVRVAIVSSGCTTGAVVGGHLMRGHKKLKGKLNQ